MTRFLYDFGPDRSFQQRLLDYFYAWMAAATVAPHLAADRRTIQGMRYLGKADKGLHDQAAAAAFMPSSSARRCQATVAPSAARRPSCQVRRRGDAMRRWRHRRRGSLHAKLAVGTAMLGDGGAVAGAAASIGNDKTKRLFDAFDFLYSRRVS